MSTELKNAAWYYANKVNILPATPSTQKRFESVHRAFIDGAEWQLKNGGIPWIDPEVELPKIEEEDFSFTCIVYADRDDCNFGTRFGEAWYDYALQKWTFAGDWAPETKVIAWCRINIPNFKPQTNE